MAQVGIVKTVVDYSLHGKAIRPKPSDEELEDAQVEGPYKVTVEAEGTLTINLADKGTIKRIYLWLADGILDITATINGTDELAINPCLVLGTGVSALVLNNASETDDWEVWVAISFA